MPCNQFGRRRSRRMRGSFSCVEIVEYVYGEGTHRLHLCAQQCIDHIQLVTIDRMAHARVDALIDGATHTTKHLCRLMNPLQWDMRVDVTTSQEHGCPAER